MRHYRSATPKISNYRGKVFFTEGTEGSKKSVTD
jgi:hypothetical protein